MKVLILDDNREEQFSKQLTSVGITEITHVKKAKECIERLEKDTYDIIFMDYDLGHEGVYGPSREESGADVAQWLKEHQLNPNHQARIIIHSPHPIGSAYMKELLPQALVLPGVWIEHKFAELRKFIFTSEGTTE